jgi:adenine-specific DNA-methyltransferase
MPDPFRWGPDNPHPLSQMRTELVWEDKYDEYGRQRSADVVRAAFPMQKIETVDMLRSEALIFRQTTLGMQFSVQLDHSSHLI